MGLSRVAKKEIGILVLYLTLILILKNGVLVFGLGNILNPDSIIIKIKDNFKL